MGYGRLREWWWCGTWQGCCFYRVWGVLAIIVVFRWGTWTVGWDSSRRPDCYYGWAIMMFVYYSSVLNDSVDSLDPSYPGRSILLPCVCSPLVVGSLGKMISMRAMVQGFATVQPLWLILSMGEIFATSRITLSLLLWLGETAFGATVATIWPFWCLPLDSLSHSLVIQNRRSRLDS